LGVALGLVLGNPPVNFAVPVSDLHLKPLFRRRGRDETAISINRIYSETMMSYDVFCWHFCLGEDK
jgi:hypothetical protein